MQRIWMFSGVALLAGAVGVLAIARCSTQEPDPLWTASDLPALPPPESNGWTTLASPEVFIPTLPDALERWTQALPHESAETLWATRPDAASLSDFLDIHAEDVLSAWHEASASPTFAHGCVLALDEACHDFAIHETYEIVALEVLQHGMAEKWSAAIDGARRMIEVATGYATSARTLLGASVAASCLARAVSVADMVAHAAPTNNEHLAVPLASLRAAVTALQPRDLSLEHALIGEYLLASEVIESFDAGVQKLSGGDEPSTWLFDRDRTLARINARFVIHMASASCSSTQAPDALPEAGWSDRLFNHAGEKLVKMSEIAFDRIRDDYCETVARIFEKRTRILQRLEAVGVPNP